MAQDHQADRIVANYLKNRGYQQTEAALRKEAPGTAAGQAGSSSSNAWAPRNGAKVSIPDYILFHNENEANNPSGYQQSYGRLRKWIDNSIDRYKLELRRVLFPIFVHAYLDLVERGLREHAKNFMEAFKADHVELHNQDVLRLSAVTEPQHVAENEVAQNYKSSSFHLRMSQYCFELLLSFLQDNKFMLILRIVNEHVSIRIDALEADASDNEGDIAAEGDGSGDKSTDSQIEFQTITKLQLGKLPPDQPFYAEMERQIKLEQPPDAAELLNEIEKVKQEPRVDAPSILYPPRKLLDIPAAINELREVRNRVHITAQTPVSICAYTFHNTYGDLQTLTISPDASKVAAGFRDSFIRMWHLDAHERHGMNPGPRSQVDKAPKESPAIRRLIGHTGPVYATSFSADQRYLVSSSEDQTARLWSLDTMSNVVVYKGHNYPVWDASFSQQGWYFATASHDKTARLWSCDHIYPLRIFVGHLADVDTVRFHPNGAYILTGSSDRTARLWNVQSGNCVRSFRGHHGSVQTVAFAPDGRTIATAGDDRAIMLWDLSSGKRIKKMIGHTDMIYSLEFSQDGAILASGGADNTVRIWDVKKADTKEIGGVKRNAQGNIIQRPPQSLVSTYPTKQTPIYSLRFTRSNILIAMGAFTVG
ncbi:WD40-repeat-containing domain protein [Fimicolochytrium jonesii]|uniref:WD40-repeat-containing domain protein n=1 Tax=Fimicolochytrium jonesii TaxID=1396493 RepID=UPI0022FE91B0|nr:WD40-repeat-containing domain protein [Fimicolochytrium jonesii]KAI8826680.1 WD40-repeat-containing domain protein [Fimicolochytrium jonesii]